MVTRSHCWLSIWWSAAGTVQVKGGADAQATAQSAAQAIGTAVATAVASASTKVTTTGLCCLRSWAGRAYPLLHHVLSVAYCRTCGCNVGLSLCALTTMGWTSLSCDGKDTMKNLVRHQSDDSCNAACCMLLTLPSCRDLAALDTARGKRISLFWRHSAACICLLHQNLPKGFAWYAKTITECFPILGVNISRLNVQKQHLLREHDQGPTLVVAEMVLVALACNNAGDRKLVCFLCAGQGSSGSADATAVSVATAKATATAIANAVAQATNSEWTCLLNSLLRAHLEASTRLMHSKACIAIVSGFSWCCSNKGAEYVSKMHVTWQHPKFCISM